MSLVKNTVTLLASVSLLIGSSVLAQTQSSRQIAKSFNSALDGKYINYLIFTPPSYDSAEMKQSRFPLLVFLHGAGEKPTGKIALESADINKLKVNGPPRLINTNAWPANRNFIVLSVQCARFCGGHVPANVKQAIDLIKKDYRVDPKRVYITGISMGGAGTNQFIANYPDVPAAAVVIAGFNGGAIDFCALPKVAWWGLTNETDSTVGSQNTVNAHRLLSNCAGREAEQLKTIYLGASGHNSWGKTYDLSGKNDIYTWMLTKSRPDLESSAAQVVKPNLPPTLQMSLKREIEAPLDQITLDAVAKDSDGVVSKVEITKISGGNAVIKDAASLSSAITGLVPGDYVFGVKVTDDKGAMASAQLMLKVLPAPVPRLLKNGTDFSVVSGSSTASKLFNEVKDLPQTDFFAGSYQADSEHRIVFSKKMKISKVIVYDGHGGGADYIFSKKLAGIPSAIGNISSQGYYPNTPMAREIDMKLGEAEEIILLMPKGLKINEIEILGY